MTAGASLAPAGASSATPAATPAAVVVGNPNSGKSTLFNALTGGGAQVGNFAGTTVQHTTGVCVLSASGPLKLVDVPGTYSLAARSPEERVAIDAVLGLGSTPRPELLIVVADAPRLQRSLYLVLQLLELGVPLVVAVNLMDEARQHGRVPDTAAMSAVLGVPVVGIVARRGEGLDELRQAIEAVRADPALGTPGCPHRWSDELMRDAAELEPHLPPRLAQTAEPGTSRARALALWLLLSVDDDTALTDLDGVPYAEIARVRARAAEEGRDLEAELVGTRYAWVDARSEAFIGTGVPADAASWTPRLDRVLLHPVLGAFAFLSVMWVVFTALFAWADPAIGAIEGVFGALGGVVGQGFDAVGAADIPALSLVRDLVVEGIIGGVGAVLVFLPQIALLFLFIAVLEDCGYLARAAHLMDRILRAAGLPGQAFVPLLSGYACAVPAILATRTMPRFRDRLLTMMVLPITSCSARLPVYTLVIAALFPATVAGLALPVRPAALFSMYLLSTVVTVLAAVVLGHTVLEGKAVSTVLELPPYRIPDPRTVGRLVWSRCKEFVREAGRVILVATVVLWALLSFPRFEPEALLPPDVVAAAHAEGTDLEALAAPLALEQSYAGRIGRAIEPAISPLGYDWKIGVGLIGAFAAREVFVSTMALVYGIGDDGEESNALRDRIRTEKRPDGSLVYTPLTGASLMVFFAFAMQCLSTVAVLRKETRGWKWPAFVFAYMTVLAWLSAFAVYQGGRLLGFA